jgi:hypothetical protein
MRRTFLVAALALCIAAVGSGCGAVRLSSAAIGYPAGPSLEPFGLRERCPERDECNDRALEALTAALSRLGPEVRDTPITSPGGAPAAALVPPGRLYVEVTVDPALEWRASTGAGGAGTAFRVDLTDDNPYVVVAPRSSFRLTEADAAAIRDALFVDD